MRTLWVFCVLALAHGSAAAQQPCVASAPQVVDDVFKHVLERPADPASAGLSQALTSGSMNVRAVVGAVVASPEYATRFFWPPIVDEAYRRILERPPTSEEMQSAASKLASGELSSQAMAADLATRAANNDTDAIRAVYRRLLGRDPDPDGLRAYMQMAERDGLAAVTRSIVSSTEYRARTADAQEKNAYAQSVRILYRHLLNRDADAEGLRALTEAAWTSGPRAAIERILGAPEYRERFGDNGIPGRDGAAFCGPAR